MRTLAALSLATLLAGAAFAEPKTFGKPLTGLAPTTLAAVLGKPENGKTVALEGVIKAACQDRGCWITFEQGGKNVHVTFEGYSFFVPKDSAGQAVKLEGKVIVKDRTRDEIEHLKEEGAQGAEGRVSIEATGLVIERPAK
jgi:KaiC/GvpD/RAD55 family RecA-like ATPase